MGEVAVHLLLIGVLVGVVLAVLLMRRKPGPEEGEVGTPTGDPARTDTAARRLGYVSRGKLFVCGPGQAPAEVHSAHQQATADRIERSRQRHGWKEGTSLGVRFVGAQRTTGGDADMLRFTSAQFLDGERLVYFLADQSMGGLFEHDLGSGAERRLLHQRGLMLDELRLAPDGRRLLCTQRLSSGAAHVCVVGIDGEGLRELTTGDSVDSSPAWVPGRPDLVVFQSSGVARSAHGAAVALGPASIQLLDVASGALSTVVERGGFDCLQPRVAPDGGLLYIRRPYESSAFSGRHALVDAVLLPFRILRTLFDWLNFQSLMYSRKPLTRASGPELEGDLRDLLLQGRRVDAEAALRRGHRVLGMPSLVPATWVLVRREHSGAERILARHVAAFDVAPDGAILYSTGYGVFALDPDARPSVVLRDRLVGEIIAG
jgi:hypothetical protein